MQSESKGEINVRVKERLDLVYGTISELAGSLHNKDKIISEREKKEIALLGNVTTAR